MDAHPVSHPTDRTLQAYSLGRLDAASIESVSTHLVGCPHCRQRVTELSSGSALGLVRDASVSSAYGLSMLGATTGGGTPPASSLPPGLADHPDYEVLRELGQGGMGVVYLAQNKLMGRLEVLKVVSGHLVKRRAILDRFLTEIRNAAKLHHPNIVTAYTALRLGESLVLAMEYVEGLDLAKVVKAKGPLPVARACYYVYQAVMGLQHAHEHGMVHRDIKPGNLMLARQGNRAVIKVLDFGLAKVQSEKAVDSGLTHEGQMLGTPDYIAPEQIHDARHADIRADIYSLGCTFYSVLTGKPPFQGKSLYDLLQAHHSMEATPLNLVRPDVPAEVAAIVSKMMAKEPEARFQQPVEVARALQPFFQSGETSSPGWKPIDPLRTAGPAPPPIPVARLPEPTGAVPAAATLLETPEEVRRAREPVRSPAPIIAAVAAAALLLVSLTAAFWFRSGRDRDGAGVDRAARAVDLRTISPPLLKATEPEPRPAGDDPESLVRDARADIRGGNLIQARLLLNQYLSRPHPGKQATSARAIVRDIDLATSSAEAEALAGRLSDREIQEYLAKGGQPLVNNSVQTPELRPVYARTLLEAFRLESDRRRSAPKADLALARGPRPAPLAAPAPESRPRPAGGTAPAPANAPGRKVAATIEAILDSPESFEGRTVTLEPLYKVGTLFAPVRGPDGESIGQSIPVGGEDDRLICRGDGRIVGRGGYLILDPNLAPHLKRALDEYKFRHAARPEHKSMLTVTVRRMDGNNSGAPVISIVGLEVLGVCNLLQVAEGHYEKAFLTLRVTPGTASVAYGDGAAWVERLGGEEKLLKPLHRKLRELRRRMVAERNNAMVGPYLQAALAQSMNMAMANAQQQARMIQGFLNRR
jgi:serine/threonine protein kinase